LDLEQLLSLQMRSTQKMLFQQLQIVTSEGILSEYFYKMPGCAFVCAI